MGVFMEDRLIRVLRSWGTFFTVWPLNPENGKLKKLFCKCLWWFFTVNIINQNVLTINGMIHQKGFVNILKSMLETMYMFEIAFNIIYCGIRRKRMQRLFLEIEQPEKIWTPQEQDGRKFTRRLHKICIPLAIILSVDITLYVFSPLITNRTYPLNVVHPYPVTKFWVYCLTYLQSAISLHEIYIAVLLDFMITIIIWHAAFKFYLLGMRIRSVDTSEKLRASIIEYQNIISYVEEINRLFSIIIFKSAILTFGDIITSTLLALNNVSMDSVEIFEFITSVFISIGRFFICCWAAEELTDKAYDVSWQIYNAPCMYTSSRHMRQNICLFIQRCQRPVVIRASEFIPMVSIRFYGRVLYTTFSFYMALRTIL